MNWKQALKEGGTRFAVYVTAGNRHYFSHGDGYYWELVDGNLLVRTKLSGRIKNDGWEPVYPDDGIYPDLVKAYEELVPPNIPEVPAIANGKPGELRLALQQAHAMMGSIGQLADELQDHDFMAEAFTTNLDLLIKHATHLRSLL